jgi:hypothetical protein
MAATLEAALLSLRELPPVVRREPIASSLTDAITTIGRAAQTGVEHPACFDTLDAAIASVGAAERALAPFDELASIARAQRSLGGVVRALARAREASLEALVALQDRLLRAPEVPRDAAPTPPFRASVGVPRLHALPGAPAEIVADVSPAALDPIDDAEGDDDDIAATPADEDGATARAAASASARLVAEHLERTARDCLTDLAAFGSLRRLVPEQPWTDAARFEQRLLDDLDALVALGRTRAPGAAPLDVPASLQGYHREVAFPDPGRAFALGLGLGCLDGEAPVRAAVLALRQAPGETRASLADGLALASSPRIGPALVRLLDDADADLAAIVLGTLRARGQVPFGVAATHLAHPDARVASAAARALTAVPERAAAIALLRRALEADADGALAPTAAECLASLGDPAGLAFARRTLDQSDALPDERRLPCVRLVALGGGPRDLPLLLDSLGQAPGDARAAGLSGHVALLDWLLASLAAANDVRRATGPWPLAFEIAAAEALHRITGLRVVEKPEAALREPGELDIDASAWASAWGEARATIDTTKRLRFGAPWTPLATLDELDGPSTADARTDAALELAIATGGAARFEPWGWVARQRARLAEARAVVAASTWEPGAFPAR